MEWFPLGGMSEQRVGEQRVELSAEQRAEIAQLIAEIDRVQERAASSLAQSRAMVEEERRLKRRDLLS